MTAQEFRKLGIAYCKKNECSVKGKHCPLEDNFMCIQADGKIAFSTLEVDYVEFAKAFNFMVCEIQK